MGIVDRTIGIHHDRAIGRGTGNDDAGQIQPVIRITVITGQVQGRGGSFIHRERVIIGHRGIVDRINRQRNCCCIRKGAEEIPDSVSKAVG